MENEVEIILNYDYDPELGYTQKSLHTSEYYIAKNIKTRKDKVVVNLYEEDIKDFLEGTGIDINGN